MSNKRVIGKHSDNNFVKSLTRYLLIRKILESNSWDELREKLRNKPNSGLENLLFQEYKMFNYVLMIEQLLCAFIERLYKKGNIIDLDKIKRLFIRQVQKYRSIKDENKARKLLDKEIISNNKNLFNPYVILYVAGMGLGNLKGLISDHTNNFNNKDQIISQLSDFNDRRTDFVHNLLSSRNDMVLLLDKGLKEGAELVKMLEDMTKEQDFSVNVKYIGKFEGFKNRQDYN